MNANATAAKLAPVRRKATPEERYDRWIGYINYLRAKKQDMMLNQKEQKGRQDKAKVEQLADYWLP